MKRFLQTIGTDIYHGKKKVMLRGINTGGWLMMEGYIMYTRNTPVKLFKKEFANKLGARALKQFEESFNNTFIRESDFKKIASMGFNVVRIPFHHGLIETKPYRYDVKGLKYLDRAISWAKKYKLWVILDLHGAAGCQNHDWHSDSNGEADLWKKKSCQKRTFALWEFLANRYKDNTTVAGYDILNEAVLKNTKLLNRFYKRVIQSIRKVDPNHIIFVEGNNWAMDIKCLDNFKDDNLALSVHFYIPLEFTFNFIPGMKYPLKTFKKKHIAAWMKKYKVLAKKRNVPILVGEFGVNSREGLYNEHQWLKDTLDVFKSCGFHWTYWTFKAIKNSEFPDGLYSYRPNPPWVNRCGPKTGWETYSTHWKKDKKKIIASWKTENFTVNKDIASVLKKAAKK